MANGEAIGLIECKGIVAAVEACDAALKAANVEFVEQHKVGSGLVSITLRGDVAAARGRSGLGPRDSAAAPGCGEDGLITISGKSARPTGVSMFLARVTGHVVATTKDKTLSGQKLFVVEPLNVKFDEANKPSSLGNTGRAIVALDSVGCGEGQLVLVVQGSSARMTEHTKNLPADALVIGIVDSAVFAGKTFYQARDDRGGRNS